MVDRLLDDDVRNGRCGAHHARPPYLQIVDGTIDAVLASTASGGMCTPAELMRFTIAGIECFGDGASVDDAVQVLDCTAEAIRDLVVERSRDLDGLYRRSVVDRAVASLCGVIELFSSRAFRELQTGYARAAVWRPRPKEVIDDLRRDLSGQRTDAIAHAGARGPLRFACVLVGHGSRTHAPLERAAYCIEVLLGQATDLGTAGWPVHRRLVIDYRTRWDARCAVATVQHVARAHGLEATLTQPTPSLRRLGAAYREVIERMQPAAEAPARRGTHADRRIAV